MTSILLILLLAFALLSARPALLAGDLHRRVDACFQGWLLKLGNIPGALRLILALGLPALLCLVVLRLLSALPLHDWLQALFALAVLLYVLGPAERLVEPAIPGAGAEPTGARVVEASQAFYQAAAYSALRQRFAPLLWFVLLGPVGALVYHFAQEAARQPPAELPQEQAEARYVARLTDWIPARLLMFTLALVGDWDRTLGAWRLWRHQATPADGPLAEPSFLAAAVGAEEEEHGEAEFQPELAAKRVQRLFRRALIVWLLVLALLAVGGWMA